MVCFLLRRFHYDATQGNLVLILFFSTTGCHTTTQMPPKTLSTKTTPTDTVLHLPNNEYRFKKERRSNFFESSTTRRLRNIPNNRNNSNTKNKEAPLVLSCVAVSEHASRRFTGERPAILFVTVNDDEQDYIDDRLDDRCYLQARPAFSHGVGEHMLAILTFSRSFASLFVSLSRRSFVFSLVARRNEIHSSSRLSTPPGIKLLPYWVLL
jgi:hypothetical protein